MELGVSGSVVDFCWVEGVGGAGWAAGGVLAGGGEAV